MIRTGAGAPKASPGGKLASEARLMRVFGHEMSKEKMFRSASPYVEAGHAKACRPHPALRATFPQGKVIFFGIILRPLANNTSVNQCKEVIP